MTGRSDSRRPIVVLVTGGDVDAELVKRLIEVDTPDPIVARLSDVQVKTLVAFSEYVLRRDVERAIDSSDWTLAFLYGIQVGHDYVVNFGAMGQSLEESRIRLRNDEVRELRALLESARRRDDTSLTGYLLRQLERYVPICSNPASEDPDVGLDDTCPNCGQDHTSDWVLAEENAR